MTEQRDAPSATAALLTESVEPSRLSKSERTRGIVLDAAEALFSERGFDATTLNAVGERAGIGGTAILYHFPTKRALYESVLEQMYAPLIARVHDHLAAPGPVLERCCAVTAAMVRFAAARPAAARLILREAAASGEAGDIVASATQHQWVRFLTALDGDDLAADPADLRLMWNVVVGSICFRFGTGRTMDADVGDPTDPGRVAEFEAMMVSLTKAMWTGPASDRHG